MRAVIARPSRGGRRGRGCRDPRSSILQSHSLLLAVVFLLLANGPVHGLDVPPLRGRVNDLAGMLPPDRAQALEQRLADFERDTRHQIVVLTIASLQGDPIEDFSIRVAENWKIGQKGLDNGAILVIARDDRKLRIEVGYGLEGVLSDAISNRIIQQVIVPRFRENDYAGGIEAGVDAIMRVARGETVPGSAPKSKATGSGGSLPTALIITAVLALIFGMTQRRILPGAFGGAAAGLFATLGASAGAGLLTALILGAILGAIGSSMSVASSGNQWTGSSRRRGWGGGWYGGGGFGGGGFGGGGGGFSGGGGGFGGGGASGSW